MNHRGPKRVRDAAIFALGVVLLVGASAGAVDFDPIFSRHAVLQAGVRHPVTGTGEPGERVTLEFRTQVAKTTVGADGRWTAWLTPLDPASAPTELVASGSSSGRRVLDDVLVGQVWVCAGQSNMAFPLKNAVRGPDAAGDSGGMPRLRLLHRRPAYAMGPRAWSAQRRASLTPRSFFGASTWTRTNREASGEFSAVGFYFGRYLSYELDMPVGLISVAVGGTPTESWVPRPRIVDDPALAPLELAFPYSPRAHPFINQRAQRNLGITAASRPRTPIPNHPFRPGFMHDSALAPLAGHPIAGVLWYQGESNAHDADQHERLLRRLTASMRTLFRREALPILTVQLPGVNRQEWPELRASQAAVTDEAGVEIVTTLDLGDPTDVHPCGKRPVGERLARLALQTVHGRPVPGRPPRLGAVVENSSGWMELAIDDSGSGLRPRERGTTCGFWLAATDRVFRRATELRVTGDRVRVRCAAIREPVAARYAWTADPPPGLVRIDDDVPVLPFKTDDWPTVRVACVGDSITQGIGLRLPYPAALSRLAGPMFDVRNFGRSGTTVQTNIERSGWMRGFALNAEHARALAFRPDLVLFNLGINDLSPSAFDRPRFEREYEALINAYRSLPSSPTVCVWTPLAPLFPGQRYYGSAQLAEIHDSIRTVAKRTGAVQIDMATPLRKHGEWFPDHLHPNDVGAAAIARRTHEIMRRIGLPVARSEERAQ